MSNSVPESLLAARRTALELVGTARKNQSAMLSAQEGWKRFDKESVSTLHLHAAQKPNAPALAEFLCRMTPAEFMQAELGRKPLTGQSASQSMAADLRMLRLRTYVIEAALAEQQDAFTGEVRDGGAFSAAKLEATLDDWLRAGRHRGAEFDDAPLSRIDATLSTQATSPEEPLQIRLGLLIPVVNAIHIWRVLEEFAPAVAEDLGWCPVEEIAEDADSGATVSKPPLVG